MGGKALEMAGGRGTTYGHSSWRYFSGNLTDVEEKEK